MIGTMFADGRNVSEAVIPVALTCNYGFAVATTRKPL